MVFAAIKWVLGLLAGKPLEAVLEYKRKQLESATEQEKLRLAHEISILEKRVQVAALQRDLGIEDRKNPLFRFALYTFIGVVLFYWTARFAIRILGLDADFGVTITELSAEEAVVSSMVLGYCLLHRGNI